MTDYVKLARQAAQKYGLNANMFQRQIKQESGFNPNARSPVGATGIAQIMPATAKGWGVNPNDPVASLDAAAKNMAKYVKQYGSNRDALVAYNAGPGRVGGALPAETQNYIKVILGKADTPAGRAAAASSKGSSSRSTTTTTPGSTTIDKNGAVVAALLSHPGAGGLMKRVQANIASGQYTTTTPDTTNTTTVKSAAAKAASSAKSGSFAKSHSPLLEMFWQGQGGIDVKNGKAVPQGFVSGHTDHVHVAAGPKTVVELGKLAQSMGLRVGENSHFGGKKPTGGHAPNSLHYRDQAVDVTGDPALMKKYAATVAQLYGIKA